MRFRWKRESSRAACISATVTRVILRKLDMGAALELALPNYAVNPEAISQLEYKRLLKDSMKELKRIEESRQSCTGYQRQRG
ncbi:hypothetical protein [Paenibacillus azoreducens]|uniref:Uncharacterized protein n=1 Tax=Paenibacillus azoreducens TaxID=116718 RepID=A0A920CSD4_9BACL|nr:hypothetical protein [Paenibacillus azoreducens]GIO48024.1 hypothetical protein J34TS1_27890 [Paenibacillus azoreducens]